MIWFEQHKTIQHKLDINNAANMTLQRNEIMSNKDSFKLEFDVGFENETPAQNTKLNSHRQIAICSRIINTYLVNTAIEPCVGERTNKAMANQHRALPLHNCIWNFTYYVINN